MTQNHSPNDPPHESLQKATLLGVDLGSNHLRLGAVDQTGKIIAFRREPYSETAHRESRALANDILSAIKLMADEHSSNSRIQAIGIALPGLIDRASQKVLALPDHPILTGLAGLFEIDLRGEISQAIGAPAHFENNANAAAFAEMTLGVARGVNDWLYLHLGANVSAGVVLGGKLQPGKSGLAGAVGQMLIDPERAGESVRLESMVSAENIVRRTRDRLKRDKTSSLSKLGAMGGFTYDDIIAAAHGGDDLAKMMMQRTGSFIGMAIADVISLLNLAMIAVGGAPAGRKFLVPAIAEEAKQRTSASAFNDCQIVAAELGAEAGVIGAALLAKNKF